MIDLFEGPQFFIGKVEAIDEETKVIKFSIPSVFDNLGTEKDFEKCNYPEAKPIGNQSTSINIGDSVFVHKPYGYVNSIFFYQHLDLTSFVGMKTSDDNFIQLIETENHENDEILIKSKKKVTIKNNDNNFITFNGDSDEIKVETDKTLILDTPGGTVTMNTLGITIKVKAGKKLTYEGFVNGVDLPLPIGAFACKNCFFNGAPQAGNIALGSG